MTSVLALLNMKANTVRHPLLFVINLVRMVGPARAETSVPVFLGLMDNTVRCVRMVNVNDEE
jgi:hypothetical protein